MGEKPARFAKQYRLVQDVYPCCLFYSSACLVIALTWYLLYHPTHYIYTSNNQELYQTESIIQSKNNGSEECDLFKGKWIRDVSVPLYTNYSCMTLPPSKNCFLQGRKDRDFLNWRWKPDKCELPRFDPDGFLGFVRGKTMAFIGDSLARNQMESLLCLLSTAETPIQIYKDANDRFVTWKFPKHDFKLKVFWTTCLVAGTERIIKGSKTPIGLKNTFHLQLDKIDTNWFEKLPSVDYAVISSAHWLFRANYLCEEGKFLGCTDCGAPNVTNLHPFISIRKAYRTLFKEINNCKGCKNLTTLLRTYSPRHFEGGEWNSGGKCNATRPYTKEEVVDWGALQLQKLQVEEIEIARNEGGGNGNVFDIIDITEMMLMRADAHPGEYNGKHWMTGDHKDCVHWCLPGPVDTWNELLLEILKRRRFTV